MMMMTAWDRRSNLNTHEHRQTTQYTSIVIHQPSSSPSIVSSSNSYSRVPLAVQCRQS